MEDHELAKPIIHPPGPSQLVLSGHVNRSGGAASNLVQQLWIVGVNPVASTSTSPSYLTPNSERVGLRLNLSALQLPKCSVDLLEMALVPTVEPDVSVKNCPVPSYLKDILVLPLGVRMPGHLKSIQ